MRLCTARHLSSAQALQVRSLPVQSVFRRRVAAQAAQLEGVKEVEPTDGTVSSAATVAVPHADGEVSATGVKISPGDADAMRFNLDISVSNWKYYANKTVPSSSPNTVFGAASSKDEWLELDDLLERMRQKVNVKDAQSAAYWAYHMARLSFFVTQGAAGVAAHELSERARGDRSDGQTTFLERAFSSGGLSSMISARATECVHSWQQDYAFIEQGLYKLPWDMTTLSHRQYSPLFAASRTLSFVNEAVATLTRRTRNAPEELWMKSGMYPSYYTNSFHFQTDGWLSAKSANVYEHSTETLFLGRQDAMQRTTLVPVSQWISTSGKAEKDIKLLEIAAGTGRFHTFIKDNWPEMKTICSDLSPFYLAKARENLRYWKQLRQPNRSFGGPDGTGVQMLQSAGENLADVADGSMDVVLHVYMFHELPEEARRKVVGEMFRVLKAGGLAVFTDSVQFGDRPEWNLTLGNFENFNEPFYGSFINTDFGAMFEEAGFIPCSKWINSSTKTLSFLKPDSPSN